MIHSSEFSIRTYHTDAFGHVNNSRHLELLEEARWQFAETIGLMDLLRQQQVGFIIMDLRMRFRVPVVEGDRIRIDTSLVTLGTSSGEVSQNMFRNEDDRPALVSSFHFILIGRATGKAIDIDGPIRQLLDGVVEK